ncbi:TPA: hypothetical protein ACH3X2_010549 [Trebouxia sp. C0005]
MTDTDTPEEDKREGILRQHEQRLEELERCAKQQNLILYNVTEGDEEKVHEVCSEAFAEKPKRLGQRHTGNDHARPLRLTFETVSMKHEFLRNAKTLRAKVIRVDDDLTRAQQQEREGLSDDFAPFRLEKKGAQAILQRLRVEVLLCQQDAHLREGESKQGIISCLMIL